MKRFESRSLVRGVSLLALSVSAFSLAQTASAQEVDAEESARRMDSVVVTTRRQEENLQDVPISITALGDDDLLEKSIGDFDDVAAYTPGLSFRDFVTGFNGVATMRGLSQANVQDAVGNVGTFVDGIYLQRGYMVNFSLADIERIEVVKGPQSALYGQNTFSGAINLVTKKPTDEWRSNGSATIGDYGRKEVQIGVGGPIVEDVLGVRAFVANSAYGGTIENNYPGIDGDDFDRFGGYDRTAYSGNIEFTPTDYLTFTASYQKLERSEEQRAYYRASGSSPEWALNAGEPNAYGTGSWYEGTLPTNPNELLSGANPDRPSGLFSVPQPEMISDSEIIRLGAEWDISDAFSLSYTYGDASGEAQENFTFPQNSYNPLEGGNIAQQKEGGILDFSSHELRLVYDEGGRFNGEVGYYRSEASDEFLFGLRFIAPGTPLFLLSDDPMSSDGLSLPFNIRANEYETEAIFARADIAFLDGRANLSLEGRYTITDVKVRDILARDRAEDAGLDPDVEAPDLSDQWKDFTPRVSLSYNLTPDNMLYGSFAKGVKSGGFNGYVTGTVPLEEDEQTYPPESNWTYEVGIKNQLLNNRLTLNAAVFYTEWIDQQISVVPVNYEDVIGDSTAVPGIWDSVGDATAIGIELESSYMPTDYLSVYGNLSYTKTEYGEGSSNPAYGDVAGEEIPGTPPLSISVGAQYQRPVYQDYEGFAGIDVNYDSKMWLDPLNTIDIEARTLVNARLGVEKGPYKAFVFVKNLTDEYYIDGAFLVPSNYSISPSFGEGRTVGLTVAYDF